jgi:hypothetical protein
MKVVSTSETSVYFYKTYKAQYPRRRYRHLHTRRRENLSSPTDNRNRWNGIVYPSS